MAKIMCAWGFFLVKNSELHIYPMFHAFFQPLYLVSIISIPLICGVLSLIIVDLTLSPKELNIHSVFGLEDS